MVLPSLTAEELRSLDLTELVQRMDMVREAVVIERYGRKDLEQSKRYFKYPLVADLIKTKIAAIADNDTKRKLADATFRFLLQLDLVGTASHISNTVVYGLGYHEDLWSSPSHWMKAAVLSQYQIVASRIALECFFDLLHIAHKGQRLPGQSKFKAFRNWVREKDNPYKYFVGHIIHAFQFDRNHRQKEVHGTSRYARALLRLERPDSEEADVPVDLTNVLLNVWAPLLQIMNGIRPSSITVFNSCDEFADQYFKGSYETEEFDAFLADILEEKMK